MKHDYRRELEERDIKVEKNDFNIDNFLTTLRQYYRGGRFDFLLNSDRNIDLLSRRFIVFEIDQVKDNRELFPVVTIVVNDISELRNNPNFSIDASNTVYILFLLIGIAFVCLCA